MLWEYILDNYRPGEPIVASDIEIGLSEGNRRKQFKILTDAGKVKRFENGIYYIPKKSKLGGEVSVTPDIVMEKKYVYRNNKILGYYSGYTFANQIGISTQVPYVQEIVTNEMGNPIKRLNVGGRTFIIRKSRTQITEDNVKVLQLLDLLKDVELYTELKGEEIKECFSRYIYSNNITKEMVDMYLPLFPGKIYKSIYETGISNVLA